MTELPQTPSKSELISRLRSTAADMDDFDGKTMKVWDEIRAKCLTHRGSDLPRLMFEALLEGFSELMIEAADTLAAPQRCSDEPAGAWQPIETAPKDSRSLLLCDVTERPSPLVVVGFYGSNMEEANSEATWRVKWDHEPLSDGYEPTHWMPLPTSPVLRPQR